ncbi:MAG: hypothetical protein NVS9B9_14630 [Ktedonobacteraceae bacterium]
MHKAIKYNPGRQTDQEMRPTFHTKQPSYLLSSVAIVEKSRTNVKRPYNSSGKSM